MNANQQSLEELAAQLRPGIERKLRGEGTDASRPEDVVEALTLLLAYAWGIERVLSEVVALESGALPGHTVSVRGYVDQLLSGEAREQSCERLTAYFRDAIQLLARHHVRKEQALQDLSKHLAAELRPSRIEQLARVPGLFKLLGLQEISYWREFRHRYKNLDAEGLREMGGDREDRGVA